MSRLLLDWLNNEYHDGRNRGLSRHVEAIGADFSNGYLLGELLYKYNQQSDFHLFSDKPEGKATNICLLEPTMRAVGVTFTTKVSADVSSGKDEVTKQLLYELKTSLDRIVKLSNQSINGKGNFGVILKVINNTRPSYDRTKSLGFENSIKAHIKSSDGSLMEKVTSKYENTKMMFRDSITSSHAEIVGALQSQRDRIKDMDVHKREHEKLFNKAWDHMNIEKWKQNMKVTHARVEAKRRFIEKTQARTNLMKTQYKSGIVNETYSSMDEFDRRMETEVFVEDPDINETVGKALQMSVKGMPGTGAPDIGYIDQRLLQQGFVRAQLTIKEHHDDALASGQTHDRRRRRFIREREAAQMSSLEKASEREILEQMLLPSNAELWEDFAHQKVLTRKKIIIDNIANRKSFIEALDKTIVERAQSWRKEEAKRELSWVVSSQIGSQLERIEVAKTAENSAIRDENISIVTDTLNKLFDLVEWTVTCRNLGAYDQNKSISLGDSVEILPEYIWKDGIKMYLSDLEIAKELPHVSHAEVLDVPPFSFADKVNVFDSSFILSKPLQTHDVVAIPNSTAPSADAEAQSPVVAIKEGQDVPGVRLISQMLANAESSQFISSVFSYAPSSTSGEAPAVVVASKDPTDVNALSNPSWLVTTPSRYYLGESLIVNSCVTNPLPDEPKSSHLLPKFDIKLSVICNSDVLSNICVDEIVSKYPDIFVISVTELVNKSVSGVDECKNENVISALERGLLVSDELYVELIVNELIRIGKLDSYTNCSQKGFVLSDFPKTKSQAILLFKAFSGIDYSAHFPQALDRQSSFAACAPRVEEKFDIKKAGLDLCLCITGGVDREKDVRNVVTSIVGARENLNLVDTPKDVSYVVYLNPSLENNPESVQSLHEPYRFENPVHASGLKTLYGASDFLELKEFLEYMTVSETVNIEGSICDGNVEEFKKHVETSCIAAIKARFPDVSTIEGDAVAPVADENAAKSTVVDTEVKLNPGLASVLVKMWSVNEAQSKHSSNELFNSFRDVRYQVLQRRRAVFDTLSQQFLLSDERQAVYFDFVKDFNAIDFDFRFDNDCKAELHLRTMELGDKLWQLCDKRKSRVEESIQSYQFDGSMQLHTYRCQVEGASNMQVELSRFFSALHIIFDTSKGFSSYNRKRETFQAENVLEETLAMVIPTIESLTSNAGAAKGKDAKGGKAAAPAGKKGEAPTAVPYRDPLPPVLLPISSLQTLPEVPVPPSKDDAAAGGKGGKPAAKAPPAKKGEAEVPKNADVSELMEKAILEVLANWEKGKFTVQRILYNNDEAYCSTIEQAVWFECDRLKYSLSSIRNLVANQTSWIAAQEADLIKLCQDRLKKRYDLEINAVQRLTTMIGDVIERQDLLRELWLLSPDIISVHSEKLFVKEDDPYVTPSSVMEFFHDTVNEEQKSVLLRWIEMVGVGDSILIEDLRSFLIHSQVYRGTLGSIIESRVVDDSSDKKNFTSLDVLVPPALRISANADGDYGRQIFDQLTKDQPVLGTDESRGTVAIRDLLAALKIE